jgi:hypothetical protein
MPENKTDYSDLVIKSTQFLDWLHKRNIRTQGTRIENLFSNLELISNAHSSKRIEIINHLSEEEYKFTFLESYSLFSIYDQFHNYPINFISNKKLKEIIAGPYLPADEESGSKDVNARNILFELELAAFIHRYGIKIIGFDDLVFEFEAKKLFVECKRIISDKGLKSNLEKAISQLEYKVNEKDNYGLIALSMDKLSKLDKNELLVKDISLIQKEAYGLCSLFIKSNEQLLNSILNEKIIGYIFVFKFYAEILNAIVIPNHCYFPIVYPIKPNKSFEYNLLNKLCNKMKI